jgi:hypothetical protein
MFMSKKSDAYKGQYDAAASIAKVSSCTSRAATRVEGISRAGKPGVDVMITIFCDF